MRSLKIKSPESCIEEIKSRITVQEIRTLIISFILGVCMYFPMITERLNCSDGNLCGILYRSHTDYDIEDIAGRYLLKYLAHVKSMYVFHWAAVLFGILCLVIGSVLICRIVHIKSQLEMIIATLFILSTPCFIETFSFYFAADAYLLCFPLVVGAVYLLHDKKSILRFLCATGMMFVSMAFYQAYIFVAVVLFLFVLIRDLLDENKKWKEILTGLAWQAGSGVAAFALYLLVNKLLKAMGLIYYQHSRFEFASIFEGSALIKAIGGAYKNFFGYFFNMRYINNVWKGRYLFNGVVLLIILVLLGYQIYKQRKRTGYMVGVIAAVAVTPIAFMGIDILNWQEGGATLLMLPAMGLFYVAAWALWEKTKADKDVSGISVTGWGLYAISIYLLIVMCTYLNIYQLCKLYYLDKTDSMAQRIVEQIELKYPETAQEHGKVFICGDVDEGNYPQNYRIQQASYILVGTQACDGMFVDNMQGYFAGWNAYIASNLGVEYEMVWEDAGKIYESEFYKNMPLFPAEGSIQKNEDGVVVVKLKY